MRRGGGQRQAASWCGGACMRFNTGCRAGVDEGQISSACWEGELRVAQDHGGGLHCHVPGGNQLPPCWPLPPQD